MKELQAKAKVTQTMTRDGLVVENQADGTVENVSCREAEQDYSTDAEGKAEKILERAEDIKDGHSRYCLNCQRVVTKTCVAYRSCICSFPGVVRRMPSTFCLMMPYSCIWRLTSAYCCCSCFFCSANSLYSVFSA